MSHSCAYEDKSKGRNVLSSTEAKWTYFSMMLDSVGSEGNMKSFFRHGRQMDRHSSLFSAFCLQSIFGISFRKLEVMT
jgi:hypothetical protein